MIPPRVSRHGGQIRIETLSDLVMGKSFYPRIEHGLNTDGKSAVLSDPCSIRVSSVAHFLSPSVELWLVRAG
jgi:hypothetical protein